MWPVALPHFTTVLAWTRPQALVYKPMPAVEGLSQILSLQYTLRNPLINRALLDDGERRIFFLLNNNNPVPVQIVVAANSCIIWSVGWWCAAGTVPVQHGASAPRPAAVGAQVREGEGSSAGGGGRAGAGAARPTAEHGRGAGAGGCPPPGAAQ